MFYAIMLGMQILTQCNAAEAALTAATLTQQERQAGYHVVQVFDDEIVDIEGFFDEIRI